MTRCFGLRNLQALVDITHADLAGQEQPENPAPRRGGEGFEEAFHLNELLGHICVLTNITRSPKVCISAFTDARNRAMSDIQQAVRDKYGAIAASVARTSTNTG